MHYMRPNAECRVPSYHVCVYAETVPIPDAARPTMHDHRLVAGCATVWRYRDGRRTLGESLTFVAGDEWWLWLRRQCPAGHRVWVWCHDAGIDFTSLGLWAEIDSRRLALKTPPVRRAKGSAGGVADESCAPSVITSPGCFVCDCTGGKGRSYRFVSSTNFAPLPLSELAAILALPYPPAVGETASAGDVIAQCEARLAVLAATVDGICRWVQGNDLGNMQLTIGSQAMSHFRHRHLSEQITIGPDEAIRPLERDGYYGARCQAYFRGEVRAADLAAFFTAGRSRPAVPVACTGPVYRLDVNQCYPYVMGRGRFPTRLFRRLESPTITDLTAAMVHFEAVAQVRLYSPIVPYPQRREGKVKWVVGTVHTTLCGPELRRALALRHVHAIDVAQLYHAAPIFATWSEDVATMRQRAKVAENKLEYHLHKRMANSLHGKFGQSGRVWQTVPGVIATPPWGLQGMVDMQADGYLEARGVGGMLQVLRTDPDARGACPAIAAWVCAYAREHVRAGREVAGIQHVYYEDADSIHVSAEGYRAMDALGLIHPDTPGMWKVEGVADSAEYRGLKHYRFGDEEMVPGHASGGHYDPRGLWGQTEWLSLDSLLAAGRPDGPITVERDVGPVAPGSECGYAADGWIVYRQGG